MNNFFLIMKKSKQAKTGDIEHILVFVYIEQL